MKYLLLSQDLLQESHLPITVVYKVGADLPIACSKPAYLMALFLLPFR